MSDNAPAKFDKFVTVWPWYFGESALYIFCKVNANSNILMVVLEPQFLSIPVSTIDYSNFFFE